MVNEDYSCIKEVTKVVNLTLPSLYNTNEISGICDALESWKRQYVKQLQGIVVGYKNVSLTSKRGYLKADCPVIYCNVKATFELFYPTIGSIIKGKINRISQDYIGCLVHDTINVTVHRTADISCDFSKFIVLDHFILFQITRIVFKSKFIHVKGKITEECITLMKESGLLSDNIDVPDNNNIITCSSPDFPCSSNSSTVINNPTISNNNARGSSIDFDTPTDTSSQTSPHKKKKKHKKSKENFLMSPPLLSGLFENNLNQVDLAQSPDSKSRKRKRKKSDVNLSSTNALENEIASTHPKKKIKTEEHITNDINQVEFSEFPNNTKKRKRKKSDVNSELLAALDDATEPIHPNKKIKTEELITTMEDSREFFENNLSSMSSDLSNFENSAVKPELSSPFKTKKHKKSKSNLDALSSSSDHALKTKVNKIEPALSLKKTSANSQIKSEENVLTSPILFDETNSETKLLKPKKKKKKKESTSDKNKTRKKKKDKLKKGSKKDKKKKIKVISSKKKLSGHNVKLKKKNKDKKSKNPKKSKNKKSQDVPE